MAPKAKKSPAKKTKAVKKPTKSAAKKSSAKQPSSKKTSPKKPRKSAKKAKKTGPKRPKNAFMFFCNANRDAVITKFGLTAKDIGPIGQALGKAWRKMSDSERKPYQEQADKDKARYLKATK